MGTGAAEWVWENSRASNGPLILMLVIAREIDAKGNCTMTVAEMAARSRLSERSVQGALREAERLGELTVTPRGRSGYSLCLAMGADSAPLLAGRGADIAPPQNLHPAESAPQEPEEPQVKAKGADSAPHQISDKRSTAGLPVVEKPSSAPRPDVDRLCAHLADRIEANGSRRPNITKRWKDAARLLIDNDGRTEQQVHKAIDWCQDDEFWRTNILSMPKLREKYDQLRLKASQRKAPARQTPDDDYAAALQRIQARKENGNGTGGNGHDSQARQIGLPAAAIGRHHLRDLASRHRPPGLRRRAGGGYRHRPFAEVLRSLRHHRRGRAGAAASRPPVRPDRRRSPRHCHGSRDRRRPDGADT